MASIGAIYTSTYHAKQLNTWPNSSAGCVVSYRRLRLCQGIWSHLKVTLLSTHGCLTSFRNHPQQKQPWKLSALIPALIVSICAHHGEKCVLLLGAWKPAYLKSSNIYGHFQDYHWDSNFKSFTITFHL